MYKINGLRPEQPLYTLTIGQFVELINSRPDNSDKAESTPVEKKYVKGVRGISELFSVSHKTAQYYKNTWLAPACKQRGRTILVDVEKAMQLFNQKNGRAAL